MNMPDNFRLLFSVFKLRIGFAIMLTALAGMAVTPGAGPGMWQTMALALAVLLSSAAAGALNQYLERDLDARMKRTRNRPFVTGRLVADGYWFGGICLLLAAAVVGAAMATNMVAALFVFLGAIVYGVIYTVWLKRRTWLNIVVGGLAGSFAVLAGAAAVDPGLSPAPLLFAVVLFLWTPPHFWSLAFVYRDDYRSAGVPMLPAVMNAKGAAWVILGHTLALVAVSFTLLWAGLGWIYFAGAAAGGIWFIVTSVALVRDPGEAAARTNFRASLLQLSLLLVAAMLDSWVAG